MIDFKKAEEAFEKYVLKFDLQNENIKMRKDHSYRVEKESYNIAKSLELNEEQVQIAKLVGLLHDIGRFEQITQYSTFVDSKSIDHAEYGVEQLNKNNLIRRFISTNKYDRIINEAIRNHNKYSINLNLNKEEMLQAKKIRDEKYIEKLIDRIDYKDEQTKKRMEYLKITAIEDINKKINKEEQK